MFGPVTEFILIRKTQAMLTELGSSSTVTLRFYTCFQCFSFGVPGVINAFFTLSWGWYTFYMLAFSEISLISAAFLCVWWIDVKIMFNTILQFLLDVHLVCIIMCIFSAITLYTSIREMYYTPHSWFCLKHFFSNFHLLSLYWKPCSLRQ